MRGAVRGRPGGRRAARSGGRLTGSLAALALVGVPTLGGCGSASDPSPPTGVDELVVPTPEPDPDDFVDGVDNPWLPLDVAPSARTYELAGRGTLTTTVAPGPRVEGVATTAVETVTDGLPAARTPQPRTDWYAQDAAGNVWWFGRDGVWAAGEDGAQAGLLMAAGPRVGDGYRAASAPGVVEPRVEVVDTQARLDLPTGAVDDVVVLEVRSPLTPGLRQELSFAAGVGLVSVRTLSGEAEAGEPAALVPEADLTLVEPPPG